VLRNFQRRRAELEKIADELPSARWSHPDWWIAKLQAEYPAHWQAILEASLQHRRLPCASIAVTAMWRAICGA